MPTLIAPPQRSRTRVLDAAERFATRVRTRRRHRLAMVVAALVLLAVAAWLALGSPWLRVRHVEVVGTQQVSQQRIADIMGEHLGRPMLAVDAAAVEQQVSALPLVRSASVRRQWPSTMQVRVVERVAVAAVPGPGGTVRLVDAEGIEVGQAATRPAGIPILQVDVAKAGGAAVAATLAVHASLPDSLRGGVSAMGATSPDGVWLQLPQRVRVIWGSAADNARKARALQALLAASGKKPAGTYDVSAPDSPAVDQK